jgi:L-threonylcarbamoyladenylate synthase
MNKDIQKTIEVLHSGGLILYPTDTIWGIGCDATNEEAVEKVFKLKGRMNGKPLIILLDNDNKLASYVREIPDVAYQLIEYAEKPLTIIYDGAKNLAENLIAEDGSIGVRVTAHPFCKELLHRFKKPIVSTSANLSGSPSPESFYDISQEIKNGVDYIVNYGQDEINEYKASTIMKLGASGEFRLIRK